MFSLKEKVLEPFLKNANFRRALKDYGTDDFQTYDKKHPRRRDLPASPTSCDRFGYNEQAAREVCIYVVDNDLAEEFEE